MTDSKRFVRRLEVQLPWPACGARPRRLLIVSACLMVVGIVVPVVMSDDVPDVSGTRAGVWSTSNAGGTVTLTVKQNGTMVTGDIVLKVDLKGDRAYSRGAISGTVDRRDGRYILSFTSGRLRADLDISETEIKGSFCLHQCGTMSFAR